MSIHSQSDPFRSGENPPGRDDLLEQTLQPRRNRRRAMRAKRARTRTRDDLDDRQTPDDEIESNVARSPTNETDAKGSVKTIEAVLTSHAKSRKKNASPPVFLSYEKESKRPIVCLAFVLPLLLFYEVSLFVYGNEAIRSGVDHWIHQALGALGLGQLVILPLITVAVLVYSHHRINDDWRFRPTVLPGLLLESAGLGLILFWAASAIVAMMGGNTSAVENGLLSWPVIASFVGSGIYEELIFRILLLVPLIVWARNLVDHQVTATSIAVVAVSLIFAAAHYNFFNPFGNEFDTSTFLFRFFASVIFAVLFLYRGFGIAVGAHVAYDLWTLL